MCEKEEGKKCDGLRCSNIVSIFVSLQEFISSARYCYTGTMPALDKEEIAQLQPRDVTLVTTTWGR